MTSEANPSREHSEWSAADERDGADPVLVDQEFPFPVIGIGASAGGLESLEKLFDLMDGSQPAAFVIVQHLSPDFKSMMDEILRRHTRLSVKRVERETSIEPNTIYLNAPKADLIIEHETLRLVERELNQGISQPIDRFFKALSRERQAACAAVVLSGSGSDGSRGIRDVCERGGMVLVESPEEAKFDGMPRAAVESGVVDFVGSVEQIAQWIKQFVATFHSASQTGETVVMPDGTELTAPVEGIQRVNEILHGEYGIDFSKYKPNMIVRRIGRRLQMMHYCSIEDYTRKLETDPEELNQLYRDLLIGVTRFFRDPEAFQVLADEVLPKLIREADQRSIRIWAPGCATGEETYSLAITIAEVMQREGTSCEVKIFATDAHRHSLNFAASGTYSTSQLEGVSPERLSRFFQPVGDGYQVRQSIRKTIVFAPQNLLKDASFTNVDLVVCRNTLIYFDSDAQKRALGLMHFGLRPGGFLFMGPSETPGSLHVDYETVHRRWRIYRKISNKTSSLINLRSPERDLSSRFDFASHQKPASLISDRMILTAIEDLAAEHLPPTFITDGDFRLLYSTAGAAVYLRRQEGRFGSTLPELLVPGLKTNVLVGLQRCARQQNSDKPIVVGQIAVSIDPDDDDKESDQQPGYREVRVVIRRVSLRGDELQGFSVTVLADDRPITDPQSIANRSTPDLSAQQTLEEELRYTKESLQATIQELETSNEELQATNEEMVAANEELQSINEELHSVNEELYTVNAEHQSKIEELTEITEDMDNLFLSSEIATLFLDDEGNIRRVTPRAADIFGLKADDAGRNLENFRNPFAEESLYDWIRDVNQHRNSIEQEVLTHTGDRFLLRVHPYQSSENLSGVVVSLISLRRLEAARRELESNETRFRGTFENAAVGIAHVGLDGTWLRVNERLCHLVGYTREELLATDFQSITHPDDLDADLELFQSLKAGDIERYSMRKRYRTKGGDEVPIHLTVSMHREPGRQDPYCISIVQDASEIAKHETRLEQAIMQRDQFLAVLSHELRNPLGAVTNAIRLLQRKSRDGDEETSLIELIDRQTMHMKSLVDDLLDTKRISAGEIRLRRKIENLADIARESVEVMKAAVQKKKQTISFRPELADLPVVGDRTRLLQVAENLLTNACRYTQQGGHIDVVVDACDGRAILTVRDNGRGIPKSQIESIFDMFIRGDSNRGTQGGLGVGLALSRMLVEKHGGVLYAESDGENQGAAFFMELPLVSDTSAAERQEVPASRDTHSTIHPHSIVLIEDDDDARTTLAKLLELDGHQVVTASNGEDGIEQVRRREPQIALVDLSMPDMSGINVISQLRAQDACRDTTFIAITGHGQPHDKDKTMQAGFSAHLVKPIDIDELNRTIASTHPMVMDPKGKDAGA